MAESESIKEYPVPGIVVTWEATRCQHARECVMGLPGVFDPKERPWITPEEASVEDLVTVIDRCPSYALGYRTVDGRTRTAPN